VSCLRSRDRLGIALTRYAKDAKSQELDYEWYILSQLKSRLSNRNGLSWPK
jgi:hypothetical protein